MKLEHQIKFLYRLRADLQKEAVRHKYDKNTIAETDCLDQVDALEIVIGTLQNTKNIYDALKALNLLP